MPKLESNLLYGPVQQTKPWRAGTPGRAPRCRRAVVDIRRPLCLCTLGAVLLGFAAPSYAQQSQPAKVAYQVRAGVMVFTQLVQDELSAGATGSIPNQSGRLEVRQRPAPAIALAAMFTLQERTALEISAGLASSSLEGSDDFESWDMGRVTLANALVGIGYSFTPSVTGHGGIGLTRLFGDQPLLAEGNGIRPMLEAGVSFTMPFQRALQLDVRAQAHRFTTTALQNEGATEGNVLRFVMGGSYTLGGNVR